MRESALQLATSFSPIKTNVQNKVYTGASNIFVSVRLLGALLEILLQSVELAKRSKTIAGH
ncbi:1630_t:CDS:2 [Paraglomus brasilianum]|uniref:1630_t:CDS:1 n=1 Tax=Paraglomus brasilianum TaxID=144538 RepID=A0A9N9ATY2_9GLOM|nr:1630_t:CDS:2 [Paraglomus brasilianum]